MVGSLYKDVVFYDSQYMTNDDIDEMWEELSILQYFGVETNIILYDKSRLK